MAMPTRRNLQVVPLGEVPREILEAVAEFIPGKISYVTSATIGDRKLIPRSAYNSRRKQYKSIELRHFLKALPRNGDEVLALTGVDIYTKDYDFIFGQSDCPGTTAVVSYYRLEDEAEEGDHDTLVQRIKNVCLHETGHLHGLKHCQFSECIMKFADCPEDVDDKTTEFCPKCQGKLRARARASMRRVNRR
eukprot:gb/GECG01000613.1/.p1 GENE.gb/GECG01000613.1/~~gb/GECG01000613.1/.p1  ORF type:complete len:191 (+),score=18.68 gb/GECG01000613.1/:1-573(+)